MGGKSSKKSQLSHLDAEISALVKRKHAEFQRDKSLQPLNKIMLQSDAIRSAFRKIRKSFRDFHREGTDRVDYADLYRTMSALGADCDDDAIRAIFHASDLYHDGSLSFNEFLVCLALAYLLDLIPGLSVEENKYGGRLPNAPRRRRSLEGDGKHTSDSGGAGSSSGEEGSSRKVGAESAARFGGAGGDLASVPLDSPTTDTKRRSSAAAVSAHSVVIRNAFHLVLEAYMYFDTKGEGVIRRDAFDKAMEDEVADGASTGSRLRKHHSKAMSFLTEERFAELDWDKDGTITFKEFLMAFEDWIGLNDDEDDDEGDADDGGKEDS